MALPPDGRKYDVALSFAGEQRECVEEVASGLRHRGIRAFYDRYEEADLWGKDLYEHLHGVYSEAADYCVVFASEDYALKLWATHERRSAQERAFLESREYVLSQPDSMTRRSLGSERLSDTST